MPVNLVKLGKFQFLIECYGAGRLTSLMRVSGYPVGSCETSGRLFAHGFRLFGHQRNVAAAAGDVVTHMKF